MALQKPDWLRQWLDNLNWDILTFHIYVGDAVEAAIDWMLGSINAISEWAGSVGDWLDDLRQEITDLLHIIFEEIDLFFADPAGYIKDLFETTILPWLQNNVPWVITVIDWVNNFADGIELFFSDPGGYIRDWFELSVLPWLQNNVPWVITVIEWISDFGDELPLFFGNPVQYIKDHQETSEWGDLFTAWEDFKSAFLAFFTDPLEWLWLRFTDWFLGREGEE